MSGKSRRRSGRPSRTGKRAKDEPRLPSQNHLPTVEGPRKKRETTFGVVGPDGDVELDGVEAPIERPRRRSAARTTSPQASTVKPNSLRTTDRPGRPGRLRTPPPQGPAPTDLPDFLAEGRTDPLLRRTEDMRTLERDAPAPSASAAPFDPAAETPGVTSSAQPFDPIAPEDDGDGYAAMREAVNARDFRKPQLGATMHGPMSDRDRRRSASNARPADPNGGPIPLNGPSPAHSPDVAGPQAVQQLRSQEAQARMDAGELPVAPALTAAQWLDYRFVALAGLALGLASLALPASVSAGTALWEVYSAQIPGIWGDGMLVAMVCAVVAIGCTAIAWSRQDLVPDGDEDMPASGYLLLLGLCCAVGLSIRPAADPEMALGAMQPLRGGFLGTHATIWAAIAAGGLLQAADQRRERAARMMTGVGALGLLFMHWMPISWLGETVVPWIAALTVSDDVTLLAAPRVAGLAMAAPGLVVVNGLLPVAILGLLATASRPPRWALWLLAGVTVTATSIDPVWTVAGAGGMAALGAVAYQLGLSVLLAVVVALGFDRLFVSGTTDTRGEIENVVVVCIIGVWLLAKVNGLRYSATDEAIYHYAARAWSDGVWPYHDFFFSHPPLHIGVPALLYGLFGFSFTMTKWISVVAALVAGIAVWRMARAFIDPMAGVLALGLFLFASEALKASTNLTGVNLTTMWSMLGLWAMVSGRGFLGGILLGVAACTGFYAAGIALAIFVLSLFAPRPDTGGGSAVGRLMTLPSVQFAMGFGLVFGTINAMFNLVAGDAFYDGVYRYHFLKPAKTAGFRPMSDGLGAILGNLRLMLFGRDFTISMYYHATQYWLAFLAPAGVVVGIVAQRWTAAERVRAAARSSRRGHRPDVVDADAQARDWTLLVHPRRWWQNMGAGGFVMLTYALAWATLTEFAQFKERYDFYYMLLLPMVSILAAAWCSALWKIGRVAIGAGHRWLSAPEGSPMDPSMPGPTWSKLVAVVALVLTFLWVPMDLHANRTAWPTEHAKAGADGKLVKTAGERLNFEWERAPGPELVSSATRALLWKDHRLRGNVEFGLHHYLWSKKRHFSLAEDIADYIRTHSEADETITGSSTHAPLIALLADRRLAADWVDTNTKVFKSGIRTRQEYWEKVCGDNVRYIVAGPMSFFAPRAMSRKPTVKQNFRLVKEWSEPRLKHWRTVTIQLWERISHDPEWRCKYAGSADEKRK